MTAFYRWLTHWLSRKRCCLGGSWHGHANDCREMEREIGRVAMWLP